MSRIEVFENQIIIAGYQDAGAYSAGIPSPDRRFFMRARPLSVSLV